MLLGWGGGNGGRDGVDGEGKGGARQIKNHAFAMHFAACQFILQLFCNGLLFL